MQPRECLTDLALTPSLQLPLNRNADRRNAILCADRLTLPRPAGTPRGISAEKDLKDSLGLVLHVRTCQSQQVSTTVLLRGCEAREPRLNRMVATMIRPINLSTKARSIGNARKNRK